MEVEKQQKLIQECGDTRIKIINDIEKTDANAAGASHAVIEIPRGHFTVETQQDNEGNITSVHFEIEREVRSENKKTCVDKMKKLVIPDVSSSSTGMGSRLTGDTEDRDRSGSSTMWSTGTRPKTPGAYIVRVSEK